MKVLGMLYRFVFVLFVWPVVAWVDIPEMGWVKFVKGTIKFIKGE